MRPLAAWYVPLAAYRPIVGEFKQGKEKEPAGIDRPALVMPSAS